MPLFYKFKPIADEDLRERLLSLTRRAKTNVVGMFQFDLGKKSGKATDGLAGLGRTKTIILRDTLLKDYSVEEIEAVLESPQYSR